MADKHIPCAKGCGHDVVVPEEQLALLAGVPGVPTFRHEVCPGTEDVVVEPDPDLRTYTVEVVVSDDDGVVARFAKSTAARSFIEASGLIGPLLGESWQQVLEHAAKVDVQPRETGSL